MTVRRAELGEAAEIARVHVRSLTKAYADILSPGDLALFTLERSTELFQGRLSRGENLFVSLVDRRIVGWARWGEDLEADWPYPAMLQTLFVDPDHQGQGHGKALIAACVADALRCGHSGLCIGALTENPRAWMLYEKLGAVRFGEGPIKIGDNEYSEILMAWDDLPGLLARLG